MSTPIPNNGKDFFSLPAEVRMGVYDELIAANDRAIFSTCSFVRKDGLSRTFRFILGTYDYVPYNLPPGSKATDQAQDVDFIIEIRINEHLASRGYVAVGIWVESPLSLAWIGLARLSKPALLAEHVATVSS